MITVVRTNSQHQDFLGLVNLLDQELQQVNGEEHAFFNQFNQVDAIRHVVVAYVDGRPVACGAMKMYDDSTMEIKRMYTVPAVRGRKIAALVLGELEDWAAELGYRRCILETSILLPPAVKLYSRQGYQQIDNYGQYKESANSVCFEKWLEGYG